MALSVGRISRMFGISRTTLLYYDKIGLFSPTLRNDAGYRLYDEQDIERLRHIIILRNAGVPLNQITDLINSDESEFFGKLIKRLGDFNQEIDKLKNFQKQIIRILGSSGLSGNFKNNDTFFAEKIINYAGIDEDKTEQWHYEFEKQSPEQHHFLLSVLGFNDEEIKNFIETIKINTVKE